MLLSNDQVFKHKEKYGTPLYAYSEAVLRERCREVKRLLPDKNLKINYSAKANREIGKKHASLMRVDIRIMKDMQQ